MSQSYTEIQIRLLSAEFRSHKKYAGKLAMFDRVFGIIPFSFPDFDPQLTYFFQEEKMEKLMGIFRNERNNPGLTEKKFSFNETYVFNIKPANSNSPVYNQFILSSFLSRSPDFEVWLRHHISAEHSVNYFLDEANGFLNIIEKLLLDEPDKSFKLQCMSIFYKGFRDGFTKRISLPDKKRKFTELFLYAQGIIYSGYMGYLKESFQKVHMAPSIEPVEQLDLVGKMELMRELGILEFLKAKQATLWLQTGQNKLSEIIRKITGEGIDQKDMILKILEEGMPRLH